MKDDAHVTTFYVTEANVLHANANLFYKCGNWHGKMCRSDVVNDCVIG